MLRVSEKPPAGGFSRFVCIRYGERSDVVWYTARMNKMLEQGIEAARALSDDRQTAAGELLIAIATHYELTPEQVTEVKLAMAEADRGEFATDESITEFWKECGV